MIEPYALMIRRGAFFPLGRLCGFSITNQVAPPPQKTGMKGSFLSYMPLIVVYKRIKHDEMYCHLSAPSTEVSQ